MTPARSRFAINTPSFHPTRRPAIQPIDQKRVPALVPVRKALIREVLPEAMPTTAALTRRSVDVIGPALRFFAPCGSTLVQRLLRLQTSRGPATGVGHLGVVARRARLGEFFFVLPPSSRPRLHRRFRNGGRMAWCIGSAGGGQTVSKDQPGWRSWRASGYKKSNSTKHCTQA